MWCLGSQYHKKHPVLCWLFGIWYAVEQCEEKRQSGGSERSVGKCGARPRNMPRLLLLLRREFSVLLQPA